MSSLTLLCRAAIAALSTVAAAAAMAAPAADHPAVQRALGHLKGTAAEAARVSPSDAFTARVLREEADGSTHVRFDRLYKGLRVIGGDLVVHSHPGGALRDVTLSLPARIDLSVVPTLSSTDAAAHALAKFPHLQGKLASQSLVIYARGDKPVLAWDVQVHGVQADQTPSKAHLIISAHKRELLDRWDDIHTADHLGTGRTLYAGNVTVHDNVNLAGTKYKLKDKTRGKHYVVDMNNGTSTETLYVGPDSIWGNNLESSDETVAADAAYGQNMTWDYYKNIHSRNGIFNDGRGLRSRVHYSFNYDNAFWDGSSMTYGDGSFFNPLVSIDVAGHEMSHGVTQSTAGLIYSGESGGLNEGTSDIFGTMVEYYANNANDPGDYLIGEKLYNTPGSALRYMINPSQDGVSADCWYAGVGNLDVHYSSGVANHFFYLLAEGTTSGSPSKTCIAGNTRVATGNGTVTGIGRAAAEKIWYRALDLYMVANETFAQARTHTIQAAVDLYGAGSSQANGVAAAWTAVNRP